MKKKLLSILLALCMAITLLPASALADAAADEAVLARLNQFKVASEKTWADVYYLVLRGQGAIGGDTLSDSTRTEIMNYLAAVEELDLQGPKAYQSSFPDLGVLAPFTGLKTLKVTGAMSGSTASLDLGALANLTNLETVVLSGNNITGIGALASCTSIKSLDLSGNSGLSEFGALASLTELKELNLSGTGANNQTFGAIQGLELTSLDLSHTAVDDIGGLTDTDDPTAGSNKVKDTLKTLDISNTSVSALDSGLWRDDEPVFSQLTTLKAQGLTLSSISGLAKIAAQEGFNAAGITWDLTGSRVNGSAGADQVEEIAEKFGESGGFTVPVTDLPSENALTNAEKSKDAFNTALGTDGGKENLTWDTLITAVYWYRQAQEYVNGLGSDVTDNAKTEAQNKLTALTEYYNKTVTKLDMSGKKESKYAISTGTLTDFKGLQELNLSDTGINDAGGLAQLTGLKKLDLSENKGINNTHFGALLELKLTELNLSGTGVSDIGGLSGGDRNQIASTLETLDISDTPVTKLESVWKTAGGGGSPAFSALKTLNAKNLKLESISGLVEIVSDSGFSAGNVTSWDLSGSTLNNPEAKEHIKTIQAKLADSNFQAPTVVETNYYINFSGGDSATGTMNPVSIPKADTGSTTYSLPAYGFTAPSGKVFQSWEVTTPDDQGITIENNILTIPDTVAAGTQITLTAAYRDNKADMYTITSAPAQDGTFTVSSSNAAEGDTVTITVTPSTGYMVDQVTVRPTDDAEAEALTVSTNPGGTYSFTMPKAAVTVTVTFKATGAPSTTIQAKFTPSGSLTGTDTQTFHYGKLELTGLKNGSYYLVAFDNRNAKPVGGNNVYPRTCQVVQGDGGTCSMICQSGLYVSVYALHAGTGGAPYVIPADNFLDQDVFGLNKQNVATSVDSLTNFTVLKNYAELP